MDFSSQEIMKMAVKAMDEKHAYDFDIMNIGELSSLGDYFIVASANSTSQVRAICDEVDEKLAKSGIEPLKIEGYDTASWILMDYGSVIIHIFLKETRDFYNLSKLWNDAPRLDSESIIKE